MVVLAVLARSAVLTSPRPIPSGLAGDIRREQQEMPELRFHQFFEG
jgi:hypothetical protein